MTNFDADHDSSADIPAQFGAGLSHLEEGLFTAAVPVAPWQVPGYRLVRRLGSDDGAGAGPGPGAGGWGSAWLAQDERTRTHVVIRQLSDQLAESDAWGRWAKASAHPRIATMHRIVRSLEGTPFAVCDYVPHGSLREVLQRRVTLDASEVAGVVDSLSNALEHLHERGLRLGVVTASDVGLDASNVPMLLRALPGTRGSQYAASDLGNSLDTAAALEDVRALIALAQSALAQSQDVPEASSWVTYELHAVLAACAVDERCDATLLGRRVAEVVAARSIEWRPEANCESEAPSAQPETDALFGELRAALADLKPGASAGAGLAALDSGRIAVPGEHPAPSTAARRNWKRPLILAVAAAVSLGAGGYAAYSTLVPGVGQATLEGSSLLPDEDSPAGEVENSEAAQATAASGASDVGAEGAGVGPAVEAASAAGEPADLLQILKDLAHRRDTALQARDVEALTEINCPDSEAQKNDAKLIASLAEGEAAWPGLTTRIASLRQDPKAVADAASREEVTVIARVQSTWQPKGTEEPAQTDREVQLRLERHADTWCIQSSEPVTAG